nr:Retrovirus-related Pol polyprotein from transposon TNT 1-94 [Ipomoea batatas]
METTPQANLIFANFVPSALEVNSSNAQAPHSEIILPVVAPIEDIIPPNVHSPNISPSTNNLADIPAVDTTEASQQEQQQLRRSSRQVSRPAYLNDYSCNSTATRTSPHALSTTADILTKPLQPLPFRRLVSKLGLHSIYAPACGGVN